MTYSLINKCAKNYYNRTFIVQVIAKKVVTCFFLRHSVVCYAAVFFTAVRISMGTIQCVWLYTVADSREKGVQPPPIDWVHHKTNEIFTQKCIIYAYFLIGKGAHLFRRLAFIFSWKQNCLHLVCYVLWRTHFTVCAQYNVTMMSEFVYIRVTFITLLLTGH